MASHFLSRDCFSERCCMEAPLSSVQEHALKCSSMMYYIYIHRYMGRSTSAPYCLGLNTKITILTSWLTSDHCGVWLVLLPHAQHWMGWLASLSQWNNVYSSSHSSHRCPISNHLDWRGQTWFGCRLHWDAQRSPYHVAQFANGWPCLQPHAC